MAAPATCPEAELPERVREYLDTLEADRLAALTLSEQKAEEAKLIKARQEGFQAALEILKGESSVRHTEANPDTFGRRRGRRMILRELSFSGQPMTVSQIATAIEYNRERTETALQRMEKQGHVLREVGGRWGAADLSDVNEYAVQAANSNSREGPNA
jgi:hypothetical protein